MPFLHPRSSSVDSPITFSQERGPGAFAPLNAIPRRVKTKKSLFHIPDDDDDNDHDDPRDERPTPPRPSLTPPAIPFPRSCSPLSPSPTDSPLPRTPPSIAPPSRITRTSSSIILSNGQPLKSSLKSSSSSSLADDAATPNRALHTRAQSMPSTPAYGPPTHSGASTPKNVHFKEDAGLATVRLFKRTGRPRAVSNQDDTETETEPEHGFPFPVIGSSSSSFPSINATPVSPLMEIDVSSSRTSAIPAPTATPYANIHLESVSLPPSRPPVLRGTVLVRNLSFEKQVGVRFTLDGWTTVSEVLATYTVSVSPSEALFHPLPTAAAHLTVGDLVARPPIGSPQDASAPTEPLPNQWDRFSFSIRLEDYEARLTDRTVWLVTRYTAPGIGEWWDNNAHQNYKVAFRPRPSSASASSDHKRGASAPVPSSAPFLATTAPPLSPVALRQPPRSFPRPPALVRSSSTPTPPTVTLGRLALKHYAAPASNKVTIARDASPPTPVGGSPTSPLKTILGGQFMTNYEAARSTEKDEAEVEQVEDIAIVPESEREKEKDVTEVDEGFETGSEDDEPEMKPVIAPTPTRKPPLRVDIEPPTPASVFKTQIQSPRRDSPPMLTARGPFSPTRESPVPFASLLSSTQGATPMQGSNGAAAAPRDSSYAALIREWCFAHGQHDSAGVTPGAAWGGGGMGTHAAVATGGSALWVGMGG
ncbi:hypothetical protein OF83DRAFT_673311 [Amylostereum chailletii]|nr:hypothetical protein OF83DRAFT_673311 [Amylostereum chailletii]